MTWLRYYALLARCDSYDEAAELEEQRQREEEDEQAQRAYYEED